MASLAPGSISESSMEGWRARLPYVGGESLDREAPHRGPLADYSLASFDGCDGYASVGGQGEVMSGEGHHGGRGGGAPGGVPDRGLAEGVAGVVEAISESSMAGWRPRLPYVGGESLDREAPHRDPLADYSLANFDGCDGYASGGGQGKVMSGEGHGGRGGGAPGGVPDRGLAEGVAGVVEVHRFLGNGSFSEVWECEVQGHPGRVAVKVFKNNSSGVQHERESQLLAALQHPHLVQLFQTFDGPPCAVFLELCTGGTLSQLIHGGAYSRLSTRVRVRAALDIASAIEYLHANSVMHRDVKPSNCLLSTSNRRAEVYVEDIPLVKLADFGLAREVEQQMSRCVGTLAYMAPELMEDESYGFPADIYSCAMLLYELVTGTVPFARQRFQSDVALILAVSMGERPSLEIVPEGSASEEIRETIQASWDDEPANRPTATEFADRLRSEVM